MDSNDSLNAFHKRHLLTSFKYVDDLLADVEAILFHTASKSPFPKYRGSLTPVQMKVVQDYIARIRAQMIHVLKSRGISPPEPQFRVIHSIKVNLEFADIAFDECRPAALRGYGDVPPSLIPELNGLVQEMKSLVRKLSIYVSQDQDLQARLQRLDRTGDEIELLKILERIIKERGLVEFRTTLSTILDRLESNGFQIAVFGRVSSGKSSLLNHIVEIDVLPVGVNPITAVPTRIVHGPQARLRVAYIDQKVEMLEIARLPEFVSEEFNPGNAKHVTRITVELPSRRLQDGVIFVDTPGLGSLATAGAAETMAYLPQCDLGVVLVDAGSTLTQEDLSTVQSLYEAAIPAFVLVSKADLLVPEDRARSVQYIAALINTQLGVKVPVHAISTRGADACLLDRWFAAEIQPLYERHQDLAQQSLRRKIGALREVVEAALNVRLEITGKGPMKDAEHLRKADAQLRKATGKFEEVNTWSLRASGEVRSLGWFGLTRAALDIAQQWTAKKVNATDPKKILLRNLEGIASEGANQIFERVQALARELSEALSTCASALGAQSAPREEDLTAAVQELPRLDPGPIEVTLRRNLFALFGKRFVKWRIEAKLRDQVGPAVDQAFERYGRMLESWSRRTLTELHRQFDAHADGYRAQIERMTGAGVAGPEEAASIRHDLDLIARVHSGQPVSSRVANE
ncbi:MAG TPA: dynamin family protein [Candidatus Sulfotelmatobacter sp.]|nr:dynamin family protein [Candidatus Sulfotelmatobacter sp.]